MARKGIHFMSYSLINSVPSPGITSRRLIKLRVCFQWTIRKSVAWSIQVQMRAHQAPHDEKDSLFGPSQGWPRSWKRCHCISKSARLHTRGLAEYRRHLPIRLAEPTWDPYSMRVWPAVQKLPAPAAALRWQKVQTHPDQTGLLQTEMNAANAMRPRRQANPTRSQQPQAWRRNSG